MRGLSNVTDMLINIAKMYEVSQDWRGIYAVTLVRRACRDNLQSLCHLSFAVAVLSYNCGRSFTQHMLGS